MLGLKLMVAFYDNVKFTNLSSIVVANQDNEFKGMTV